MAKVTMTQAQALAIAIECMLGNDLPEGTNVDEAIDKIKSMKQTLENKRSTPSKADREKQAENENFCEVILEVLTTENKMMSITEIQTANEKLSELSNQKMSSLLRKLVDSEKVERVVDKRKTYFKAVAA